MCSVPVKLIYCEVDKYGINYAVNEVSITFIELDESFSCFRHAYGCHQLVIVVVQ